MVLSIIQRKIKEWKKETHPSQKNVFTIETETDRQTYTHTYRQTYRQTDIQTDRLREGDEHDTGINELKGS